MVMKEILVDFKFTILLQYKLLTRFSSEIGTKLRDWAVEQAGAGCYSQAAMSSNDSKTRYIGPMGLHLR